MKLLFSAIVFLASFLLFTVQPMLVKAMLPYLGGTPSVWILSMLFFQLVLLMGYGYASLTSAYMSVRWQIFLHFSLMLLAISFTLPVSMESLKEPTSISPENWILVSLFTVIGLPYFLLSANASLMQRWYFTKTRTSPYFLFALSNAGGLSGLLAYPLLIEWAFPLTDQMYFWSLIFSGLACGLLIIFFRLPDSRTKQGRIGLGKMLPLKSAMKLVFYGFVPSSLFLSTTLFITTDIAAIPLLWIIPLSLYLLSFMIAFSRFAERWVAQAQSLHIPLCAILFLFASYVFAFSSNIYASNHYLPQIFMHLLCLLVIATSIHGEAAREKPEPHYLTSYYFWLAVGGTMGGVFNSIAPKIFNDIYEYPLVLLLSILVPLAAWFKNFNMVSPLQKISIIGGCSVICMALFIIWIESKDYPTRYQTRNFFGIKKVTDYGAPHYRRSMAVGSTMQGHQPLSGKSNLFINHHIRHLVEKAPRNTKEKRFAVIGLGVGMLACIAKAPETIDFYEIDPSIITIANNEDLFHYVRDCPGNFNIIAGDGRQKLKIQPSEHYDMIILDAFSSSAIPTHLLTQEAIALYKNKLNLANGLLAFHITNRHIDLREILGKAANNQGLTAYYKHFQYDPKLPYDGMRDWVFMLSENSPWHPLLKEIDAVLIHSSKETPLWTDNYSALFPILK